jgi:hypothetical protein
MVKMVSGGGITSNKYVTSKAGAKVEPVSRKANPAGAAQQGMATQFEKEKLIQGKGYTPGQMGPTGIANARQGHSGAGPGGGNRTIYGSGSQSPTPQAKDMPKGRDTLSEYGPEVPGRGNR